MIKNIKRLLEGQYEEPHEDAPQKTTINLENYFLKLNYLTSLEGYTANEETYFQKIYQIVIITKRVCGI